MKKVISLMLAATMMLGICACGANGTTATTATTGTTGTTGANGTTTGTTATTANPLLAPDSEGFDESNIVLQFGAVSDIHTPTNSKRVQNALEQLKEAALLYTDKGLDAIVVAGDLTDSYGSASATDEANLTTKKNEIIGLKNVYETVFGSTPSVPMIYALGNHDHDFERAPGTPGNLQVFLETMGNQDVHMQYDIACSDSAHGSRHAVIGNYHFLFVEPITYSCNGADDTGAKYYAETKAWLDAELQAITEANPNQYVFVITHPMLYGTVYGSELLTSGIYWYTKDLNSVLDKYPQVVTFGGHLHFPINDELSIMQKTFTSLGCGSVQYMAIENGGYDNMASATTMNDKNMVSSGYLVQVDADGNVRFIRMDFQNKTTIKIPFVIETPKADGSHLDKYSPARAETNKAPVLSGTAITIKDNSADLKVDVLNVEIGFLAGTDDDLIHHYVLEIKEKGAVVETHKILTDYYRHGNVADMKSAYNVVLTGSYSRGAEYEVCLTAYDSWGAASNTVVAAYKPVLDVSNVTLPDAYADIDFAGGVATDNKGNVSVQLVGGAKVEEGSYTFAGATKTLTGINIKGDGYAKVTFDKCNNINTISDLLKKEYSVELLYVNRSKTGTQDIFGGYKAKGFGLYEENGVPTFTNKLAKEFKTVAAKEATSATELVHVIITYSSNTSLFAIYVNGERTSVTASGFAQMDSNVFAIGANYGEGTVGTSAADLSVVDVKIYAAKFSQAQAIVRYQNVVAEFTK